MTTNNTPPGWKRLRTKKIKMSIELKNKLYYQIPSLAELKISDTQGLDIENLSVHYDELSINISFDCALGKFLLVLNRDEIIKAAMLDKLNK